MHGIADPTLYCSTTSSTSGNVLVSNHHAVKRNFDRFIIPKYVPSNVDLTARPTLDIYLTV